MPRLVCDQKEIAERETWNSSGDVPPKRNRSPVMMLRVIFPRGETSEVGRGPEQAERDFDCRGKKNIQHTHSILTEHGKSFVLFMMVTTAAGAQNAAAGLTIGWCGVAGVAFC